MATKAKRTGKRKRRYSDKDKAAALVAIELNHGDVYNTAKQLNIPHKTLDNWAKERCGIHPEIAELGKDKKEQLANQLRGFMGRVLKLTTDDDIRRAPLVARITALAIAADKSLLLDGDPTSINANADLTDDQIVERMRQLADRVRKRLAAEDDGGRDGRVVPVVKEDSRPVMVPVPQQSAGNGLQQSSP